MGFIDEATLDEEQKKFFKGLDDKLEELNVKFLKEEISKGDYNKQLKTLMDEFNSINEKSLSAKVDTKTFDSFKQEVMSQLVKLKSATEVSPKGEVKLSR